MKYTIALLIIVVSFIGCDDGISPKNVLEPAGFSGTVTFKGEWPPDIKRTFIVVFKDPLLAASDFTINNLKFLSMEIPFGVETYNFSSLDTAYIPQAPGPFQTGTYAYIAVAQQKTENLSLSRKDWFVAGIYYAFGNPNEPGSMVISENVFLKNINITCDFNNPPPQPPGGI